MSNVIIWQTENAGGDVAQLVYNDKVNRYGIITTDCGRPQVIHFDKQEAGKLLHHLTAFIMDMAINDGMQEEHEKSEKDAMWERD